MTSVQKKIRDFQIKNEKARNFLSASQKVHNRHLLQLSLITLMLLIIGVAVYVTAIRPLFDSEISLEPVELNGAGVNALQALDDGSVYAGLYNYQLKNDPGPCLARLLPGTGAWQTFGPICNKSVNALWINPLDPQQIYFSHTGEAGLHRTLDGGASWEQIGAENGLPLENITSIVATEAGLMFAADYRSTLGVYQSTDQGKTWTALSGSPAGFVYTLVWHSPKGLLVGGNGGVWLWKPEGAWEQLIAPDVTKKDQSILSVVVVPAPEFAILAGGDEGMYVWKEGEPPASSVRNDTVKMAYSLAVVNQPETYVVALTFPNSKIWRMTTEAQEPRVMRELGSDGLPLIAQEGETLQLWVGTVDRLYMGQVRTKILEVFRSK